MNGIMMTELYIKRIFYFAIFCVAIAFQAIFAINTEKYTIYFAPTFTVMTLASAIFIRSPNARPWYAFISSSCISKDEIISNQLKVSYIELTVLALMTFTITLISSQIRIGTMDVNKILLALLLVLSVSIAVETVNISIVQWIRGNLLSGVITVIVLLFMLISPFIDILYGINILISGVAVISCVIISTLSFKTGERYVRGADI